MQVVQKWAAAFNASDVDAIVALYSRGARLVHRGEARRRVEDRASTGPACPGDPTSHFGRAGAASGEQRGMARRSRKQRWQLEQDAPSSSEISIVRC